MKEAKDILKVARELVAQQDPKAEKHLLSLVKEAFASWRDWRGPQGKLADQLGGKVSIKKPSASWDGPELTVEAQAKIAKSALNYVFHYDADSGAYWGEMVGPDTGTG